MNLPPFRCPVSDPDGFFFFCITDIELIFLIPFDNNNIPYNAILFDTAIYEHTDLLQPILPSGHDGIFVLYKILFLFSDNLSTFLLYQAYVTFLFYLILFPSYPVFSGTFRWKPYILPAFVQ